MNIVGWADDHRQNVVRLVAGLHLALVVLLWTTTVWYIYTRSLDTNHFAIFFIGLILVLFIVDRVKGLVASDAFGTRVLLRIAGYLAIGSGVLVSTWYLWMNYETLRFVRIGGSTEWEMYLTVFIIGTVLLFTYLEYGLPISSVAALVIVYAYFGPLFPGLLRHSGLSATRIASTIILNIQGIYGSLTGAVINWIALFMLYAGLVHAYGGFDYVFKLTAGLRSRLHSGVAQVAIVASMIVGSVNGSGVANTGITGSMTIPTMKRSGIKAEIAAATEAVASTGGQIMPPIMGTAAFLMASLLPITYSDIIIASVIPALIFYIAIAFAIHLLIPRKAKAEATDDDILEVEYDGNLLVGAVKFGLPFVILVFLLGVVRFSISYSGMITVASMVLLGAGIPILQAPSLRTARASLSETVEGLKRGAAGLVPITIVVATINVIIDVLILTGTPSKFSLLLMDLSGGVLVLALLISFIVCVILGMGMPTTAAYLLVAILVAPAMVRNFGLSALSIHMFVFYSAMLSMLTPPIALSVVVASGIAEANFWKSCSKAIRIGYPMFILPFVFIHQPIFIATTFTVERLVFSTFVFAGILTIGYGLNKSFQLTGYRKYVLRAALVALGFGLIYFGSTMVGILFTAVLIGYFLYQRRDRVRNRVSSVEG